MRSRKGTAVKFKTPFETIKSYSSSEPRLYKAIIVQAIADIESASRKAEDRKAAREARNWILGNGEDFHFVCMVADVQPASVTKFARERLNMRYNKKVKKCKDNKIDFVQESGQSNKAG